MDSGNEKHLLEKPSPWRLEATYLIGSMLMWTVVIGLLAYKLDGPVLMAGALLGIVMGLPMGINRARMDIKTIPGDTMVFNKAGNLRIEFQTAREVWSKRWYKYISGCTVERFVTRPIEIPMIYRQTGGEYELRYTVKFHPFVTPGGYVQRRRIYNCTSIEGVEQKTAWVMRSLLACINEKHPAELDVMTDPSDPKKQQLFADTMASYLNDACNRLGFELVDAGFDLQPQP